MGVIDYVMTTGLSLVLIVFMGISVSFAKQSWDYYKKYKDYIFIIFSLGLFGILLMSFALFVLIMSQLFTGVV